MRPTRTAGELKPFLDRFKTHFDLRLPVMAWQAHLKR
jgi:hypothetical protein